MIKTPITILDNFFDNPDKIRDYALSLEYEKDHLGKWPGKRSKPLHEINPPVFNEICRRVLSMYFDLEQPSSYIRWEASLYFQKIDNSYLSGWIHTDPSVITAIVYLNKNPNINSGTSIYKLKDHILFPKTTEFTQYKLDAYRGIIDINDAKVKEKQLENNSQFEEVVKVHNEYNRILSYYGGLQHSAQDYFGNEDEEPRLTLIMFFHNLRVNRSPVDRVHFKKL
jgi:hypothetical protein